MKAFWKSKTMWFNVLSAVVMVGSGSLGVQIDPHYAVPAVAIGNMGLRMITNQPLGATDQPKY